MRRREFLEKSAVLGVVAAIPSSALGAPAASLGTAEALNGRGRSKPATVRNPLTPPAKGSVPVAFP